MRIGTYLHPEDLSRLPTGLHDFAIPTSYHAGRWTRPTPGTGLVTFLEDGTVHFRPSDAYGALRPEPSSHVRPGEPSPLDAAIGLARASGVEAHAWTVLFHNSRLGRRHHDACCRNAAGDVYTYALCPANPSVRAYALQLVTDIVSHAGLAAVELEAAGFMGYKHGSHHDKSSFHADPFLDFLLSYCFCPHCMTALGKLGEDAELVRRRVEELLVEHLIGGDAMVHPRRTRAASYQKLGNELGDTPLQVLLQHRTSTYQDLLREVRQRLVEGVRLSLHVKPDSLFSGSQMGQPCAALEGLVDEIVLTHYGDSVGAICESLAGIDTAGIPARVAIWPKAPEFESENDLHRVRDAVEDAGLAGLRIYHLGLLPERTVRRVLAAWAR